MPDSDNSNGPSPTDDEVRFADLFDSVKPLNREHKNRATHITLKLNPPRGKH